MRFINQLDYAHIPYHTRVKVPGLTEEEMLRSVRKSGCGLCCTCMMVDILTDKSLDIEECVRISEGCFANHNTGTDMKVLAPVIAEKFELEYRGTDDLGEAIEHLRNGGVIIAHVWTPIGAEKGLFTNGSGHYIALIATDGKDFCILDPSYSEEKYADPARVGRVDASAAPYLYADVNVVDAETKLNRIKYHLFARKRK